MVRIRAMPDQKTKQKTKQHNTTQTIADQQKMKEKTEIKRKFLRD